MSDMSITDIPPILRLALQPEKRHHALLFCHLKKQDQIVFLKKVARFILCQNFQGIPCHVCQSCRLISLDQHPDLMLIQPEKIGGTIKVEQIREMLATVYVSPKMSHLRVVMIPTADELNQSCGNALLKVLEEPPSSAHFILNAQNQNSLLPTIVSRCQIWRMNFEAAFMQSCSTYVVQEIALALEKKDVLNIYNTIVDDLYEVITKKSSICLISARWQPFELTTVLQILYFIIAQLIRDHRASMVADQTISCLHTLRPLSILFQAVDYLHAGFQKINHNIHMNKLLVIENFLMILMREPCDDRGR